MLRGSLCRSLIIQDDNELIPAVLKHRLRQSIVRHGPANCGNSRVPVFRAGQLFSHDGQRRVAKIRSGNTQLLHRHAAIQTAGAMDLQPVGKKVDLHRRSLCIDAIISVNDRIQNGLADGIDRIFRPILPCAGDRINDRADLHIPAAEGNGILHHRVNGAFDALIVGKAGRIGIRIADLRSRNNNCGNAKLREIALRIETEIHDGSQGHFPVADDIQHFQRLLSG